MGCASKKHGPQYLYPADKNFPDYSFISEEGIFDNGLIRISARSMKQGELEEGPVLIKDLLSEGYVIFRMDIENNAEASVTYNPSFTALMDNAMGYGKPLDYTDLYYLAKGDEGNLLASVKGKFFDLNTTVMPGKKTSGFLIFRPLERRSTKAELVLKEVYIGVDTVNLRLPFVLKSPQSLLTDK